MAEKRMFSKKIIDTDWFMDMPSSTQNLYFHLSMRADDDGFVANPKRIIKLIGATEDDYKILIGKKFVIPFESGICVITDWRINNYLRADRYTETMYQEEKNQLLLDENAHETGEQLINYVVAKYGASGVETIEVEINSEEEDMIDLFSKACGFRYCLDYQIYKLNKKYFNPAASKNCLFRPFKSDDAKAVSALYNENILPYYKFPLSKKTKEFEDSLFSGLSKHAVFKYILEDKKRPAARYLVPKGYCRHYSA